MPLPRDEERRLRQRLAELFPRSADRDLLIADAGLSSAQIVRDTKATADCQAIINEAKEQRSLAELVDAALLDYPKDAVLVEIRRQLEQAVPSPDQILAPTPAQTPTQPSAQQVDLAIIAAMPEELDPVLKLVGADQWRRIDDRFVFYHSEWTLGGRPYRVLACTLGKYGGDDTAAMTARLVSLRPRLLAMTGICAGREGEVELGDLVVADRAFRPEEGKLTPQGLQADVQTYQPPGWLMQRLRDFSRAETWQTGVTTPRPRSLRYQAEWLLCRMAQEGRPFPEDTEDWAEVRQHGIAAYDAVRWLQRQGWLSDERAVTPAGRTFLDDLRWQQQGRLLPRPDRDTPLVHIGAFASTVPVVAAGDPFAPYRQHVRKVLAIDLEVCSLLATAASHSIPACAVKGVCDFGTIQKDDAFHSYAAEVSARWLYAFLESHSSVLDPAP